MSHEMDVSRAWRWALVGSLLLSAGCGVSEPDAALSLEEARSGLTAGCALSYVDGDWDGLDDGLEDCLLQRHAPVMYLPWDLDHCKPANVDWYLARTHLRFHHNNCGDCGILGLGSVTQGNLANLAHAEKRWSVWKGCYHDSMMYSYSDNWSQNDAFFLQVPNDANEGTTHRGSSNPADWKAYGHVYRNSLGGVNLQYWLFFAYNDYISGFNHEGDWEHVNVRLRPDYSIDGVYLAHHHDVAFYSAGDMQWYDATHPYIWTADGSHASYRSEQVCDTYYQEAGFSVDSCQTNSDYRWFTWAGGKGGMPGFQGAGVINVGEKAYPLNGQSFIRYNSHWGEIGTSSSTSGPRTPSFNPNWLRDI